MKKLTLLIFLLISILFFLSLLNVSAENFYDNRGRYEGRVDDNGNIYDSRGRYDGSMR